MKCFSLSANLAVLATILLTQCADKPAPRSAWQANTSYLPSEAPVGVSYGAYPNTVPNYGGPSRAMPTPFRYVPPAENVFASPAFVAPTAPSIRAASYILCNADTGEVLAARNADEQRHVASTQKILTALIVVEEGDLDRNVRISASDVAVEPSKMGVKPGEVYTRRQLLYGFLVKSSNDIANALARDNAGSIGAFAQKMTARARQAGAYNSVFRNPHGLTASGQYSSARDMARIAAVAYRNPVIRDAVRRRYYGFRFNSGRVVSLENTNDLLGMMPECDGMKTGYTNPAGRCLISTAHRGGRDVILVQLGTKTKYIWDDGALLMRWGLSR